MARRWGRLSAQAFSSAVSPEGSSLGSDRDSCIHRAVTLPPIVLPPMTLQIGDPAPDFTLPDENGQPVTLSSLKGQRVVIYFYPKDATPGCTKEACNFRDRWGDLQKHNIKVLGISKDNAASHTRFIAKQELPFTLLTDEEPCAVASSYESYGLKKFMGREYMGMMRHTFVVDAEGKLELILSLIHI